VKQDKREGCSMRERKSEKAIFRNQLLRIFPFSLDKNNKN